MQAQGTHTMQQPGGRVWVYRNSVKALPWFTSVREKLEDPAYWGACVGRGSRSCTHPVFSHLCMYPAPGWFLAFKNCTDGRGGYLCGPNATQNLYHDFEQVRPTTYSGAMRSCYFCTCNASGKGASATPPPAPAPTDALGRLRRRRPMRGSSVGASGGPLRSAMACVELFDRASSPPPPPPPLLPPAASRSTCLTSATRRCARGWRVTTSSATRRSATPMSLASSSMVGGQRGARCLRLLATYCALARSPPPASERRQLVGAGPL